MTSISNVFLIQKTYQNNSPLSYTDNIRIKIRLLLKMDWMMLCPYKLSNISYLIIEHTILVYNVHVKSVL